MIRNQGERQRDTQRERQTFSWTVRGQWKETLMEFDILNVTSRHVVFKCTLQHEKHWSPGQWLHFGSRSHCYIILNTPIHTVSLPLSLSCPFYVFLSHTHTHDYKQYGGEKLGDISPRLRGLDEGSGSESWLSSQEVLFLTTLHKHWKRDSKKKNKKMSQTHYFHCKHTDLHIL